MSSTTDNWITGILLRMDAGRITAREAIEKAVEYGAQQASKPKPASEREAYLLTELNAARKLLGLEPVA